MKRLTIVLDVEDTLFLPVHDAIEALLDNGSIQDLIAEAVYEGDDATGGDDEVCFKMAIVRSADVPENDPDRAAYESARLGGRAHQPEREDGA